MNTDLDLNVINIRALTNSSHYQTNKHTSVNIIFFTRHLPELRRVSIYLNHLHEGTEHQ
jgi:hypothetical protein